LFQNFEVMPVTIKLHFYIAFIFSFFTLQESFLGGLKFNGNDYPINKRTSYSIFGDKTVEFSEYFEVEFNLSLYSAAEIGYIIRIKNRQSDKIYNLFYDGQGENIVFRFNEEGKSSLIIAEMDKEELLDAHWFKMKIAFDLKNDSINLTIHNQSYGTDNAGLSNTYYPVIVFGKSDHIIDVPSFAIKSLSVGNQKKYFFELRENEGDVVHEFSGEAMGEVSNPGWLINDAYHWKFRAAFKSETVAGANYNTEKKEIYYFNRDSIIVYNMRSGAIRTRIFEDRCPVELILGTNFIDTVHSKLYSYEVYYDTPYDGPTVAGLDLETYRWTAESFDKLPTQLHHHGGYLNMDTEKYTIFGGFGNMHYSKNFYSYDLNEKAWQMAEDFSGDAIAPRYFSSVGYLKKTNSIYIFGGMGNESGEQIVGREYFYDLHKVDLNTKQITKLWEIPWDKDNVVPVRGMVVPDDSCFYTLCYPEHFSDSFLKLYRFSLKDGSYEILGDSIPVHSDRITTNANLYYDSGLNSLYAVVQEFDDDIISDLKVYSLAFPPITAEKLVSYSRPQNNNTTLIVLLLAGTSAAVAGYFVLRKLTLKNKADQKSIGEIITKNIRNKNASKPNSVYLFGDFTVKDRNNRDITYRFSAKLRQVFCLILHYSINDGITSQHLSDILWPGKPQRKVKNSRGVTLNHLRKILNELDGIELIYEKSFFKLVQSDTFYCDYTRCIRIVSAENIEAHKKELVEILNRGKFLKLSDHPLFDSFKEDTEQKLEPLLLVEMEKSFTEEDYRTTIDIAEAIFNIDPLSETALAFLVKAMQRLKMNEEARIRYETFAMEYRKIMGNDYPQSFKGLS